MRGRVTHAGFVSRISHVSTEDALVVKQLLQAGAIIHIRTNQPQSLMVNSRIREVAMRIAY